MTKTHLLIIDPQNDFCDKNGSLFVTGADQDSVRLSDMIRRVNANITQIHVTLDSHRTVDIAHPIFWRSNVLQTQLTHPDPFTIITADDIANGKWTTTNPAWANIGAEYVKNLAKNGRYPLCIWPPHCLIASTRNLKDGTEFCGHAIVLPVSDALIKWEETNFGVVNYIPKGSNLFTEHYSAIIADVPDPNDSMTQLNTEFLNALKDADVILVAGEALSHCVCNTVTDLGTYLGKYYIQKMILLEDCCSNVTGFEKLGNDFIQKMTKMGMRVMKSTEVKI